MEHEHVRPIDDRTQQMDWTGTLRKLAVQLFSHLKKLLNNCKKILPSCKAKQKKMENSLTGGRSSVLKHIYSKVI